MRLPTKRHRSSAAVAPATSPSGSRNLQQQRQNVEKTNKNLACNQPSTTVIANTNQNSGQMILNGLKFNCLARWNLQQSMTDPCQRGEGQWKDILKAMEGNTSVTDLYMGPYFYSSMTPEELDSFLLRCAKQLSQLRVLSIGTLEFTKTRISGSTLGASFLQQGVNCLQTLRVERELMLRTAKEVIDLAAGFKNHPRLQRVSLSSLHPGPMEDSKNCLDPLLESLATCRNLESLQLGLSSESHALHDEFGVSSPQAVALLGTLPRLTWLVLSRLHIGDDHIVCLCDTLKGPIDDDDHQNNPYHPSTPTAPLKIVDLTKTRILTERAWGAVMDLLKTQVHLEVIDMPCSQTNQAAIAIKRDVHLYLRLNREGRRKKLREMTNKRDWLDLVARYFSKDLTLLATVVRESPWICIQNS